jgi:hypothetical protein
MRCSVALFALASLATLACSSATTTTSATGADAGSEAAAATLDPSGDAPSSCTSGAAGGAIPTPRSDTSGALSPLADTLLMFGGDTATAPCGGAAAHTHAGDTWLLDVNCRVWREAKIDGPGARARHAIVADPARGRALLFGGRSRAGASGAYTLFSDVWSFDFQTEAWEQLATTGAGPKGRSNAATALDATGNALVVFGGNASTSGLDFTPLDDTWSLDLTTLAWTPIATKSAPPARLFHAMAIDDKTRTAYVFSGGDAGAFTGPFLRDVWALDVAAASWRQVATSGETPTGRIKHGLAFDTTTGKLLTFGGHDDGAVGNQNDVYALDVGSGAWTRLPGGDVLRTPSTQACVFAPDFTTIDVAAPERRSAFVFAPRADGHGFAVAQGVGDCGLLGDAHWFGGGTAAWSALKPSPVGLSCLRAQTTCVGLCG